MSANARVDACRAPLAAVALAGAALSACVLVPPPAPSAPSPFDSCSAVSDSLNAVVPPGESLAELQARGVRVRTPLSFAPGAPVRPQQPSGAAVRVMISPEGTVVPGSPRTLKSVGEAQVASAMEAATLSMSFDFEAGARPAMPIPFTAVYAACLRS